MRIQSIDAFRIVAAFLVVSLHVNWPVESIGAVMGDICRIAVPYFFVVSGYFYKPEKTWSTIKRLLKYTLIAVVVYLLVEGYMYGSPSYISKEISVVGNYRFWIGNVVPFCPVAWYLASYIYVLVISYFVKKRKIQYLLGVASFLFALLSGPYFKVLSDGEVDSLMWNCCFLSSYCWFALGIFMRDNAEIKRLQTASGGGINTILICCFIISLISIPVEHWILKYITGTSVSGTTFVFTLTAVFSLFVLLLRFPLWGAAFKPGKLPLFVFLSHVAINYILVSLFWPTKFDLPHQALIHFNSPQLFINNIIVFALACLIYYAINRITNIVKFN